MRPGPFDTYSVRVSWQVEGEPVQYEYVAPDDVREFKRKLRNQGAMDITCIPQSEAAAQAMGERRSERNETP